MATQEFQLIRKANVAAFEVDDCLQIVVNDDMQHTFPKHSRPSRALNLHTAEELGQRLNNGTFFFVQDTLVDYRDGDYNGFVHSDSSIARLHDTIGIRDGVSVRQKRTLAPNSISDDIILNNAWSGEHFDLPGYLEGGAFTSELSFSWSPFADFVKGIFSIVRLICKNGAVGTSSLVNSRVPLINRWEEHLDIASRQIQGKLTAMMSHRLHAMINERADVTTMLRIAEHAKDRIQHSKLNSEHDRLVNISRIADPRLHLNQTYHENVFNCANVGSTFPAHVTAYDAWNLITEMGSHTEPSPKSSVTALQRMANELTFDHRNSFGGNTAPAQSCFSNANAAFFGAMAA